MQAHVSVMLNYNATCQKATFVKLLIITSMKDPLDTIIRKRFQTFDYSLAIDVLIQQTTGK